VRVDNADDKGRLSGVAETPGTTSVSVSVAYKALGDQVPVRVGPPLTQPRPVVECIYGDPQADRWDILLVIEGFTADQRSLVGYLVRLLVDRLFQSRLQEPFPLLKDSFNVWVAFEPSAENGVTPGSFLSKAGGAIGDQPLLQGWPLPLDIPRKGKRPTEPDTPGNYDVLTLVSKVGLPDRFRPIPATRDDAKAAWAPIEASTDFTAAKVEDRILDFWLSMREYHLMQARDTRCGLLQGVRYGDRSSRAVEPGAPPDAVMRWYLPSAPARGLGLDRRRLPRNWDRFEFHLRYIRSLTVNPAKHGAVTLTTDKVVYLANQDYDGGQNVGFAILQSVRNGRRHLGLQVAGRRADHEPIELVPIPTFADLAGTSIEQTAGVLGHELGHWIALGDEYEGFDWVGKHDVLRAEDTDQRETIDRRLNLTHHHIIRDPAFGPDAIDVRRVKWRAWHRIRACSVLTADAVSPSDNHLRVTVDPGELRKWRDAKDRGAAVFVRTRNINDDDPDADPLHVALREGPLTIEAVHADGRIDLVGSSLVIVGKGDVLYEPEVENGAPLTVFHPAVLEFLGVRPALPFAKKADITKGNRDPGFPPDALFQAHPAFTPADLAAVVGVYEGAGTYNSKVYRSSGICRMRTTRHADVKLRPIVFDPAAGPFDPPALGQPQTHTRFVPFCYVCQYALTNEVDPSKLDGLVYPR
jgi:hypothetical protein